MMDRSTGRAVRRTMGGRRALLVVLLALATMPTLGVAQAAGREPSGWTRMGQVVARMADDSIAGARRAARRAVRDTTPMFDASAIAAELSAMADSVSRSAPPIPVYRSRADSVTSMRTRLAADREQALRIVISLNDRRLWAIVGSDTLLKAPVAVSTDETLEYAGKSWRFETPRGVRTVRSKLENPVWIPPDWHYAEVAKEHGLKLAAMTPGKPTVLSSGDRLEVRNNEVGIVDASTGEFALLRNDEEVIFDSTLFIPPVGTLNRRIDGELGDHMLDTGNGFLLHGTPHKSSIGTAATHGCIRLRDEDIAWLYDMIPVGTRVYIY